MKRTISLILLCLSVLLILSACSETHVHYFGEWTFVKKPTCTEDGYTENDCTKCGYHLKGDIVPALGHDISDAWQKDVTYHWHGCSRCDGQFNKVEHNYGAWSAGKQTCEICGFE